jgi:alanine dehydrogenase
MPAYFEDARGGGCGVKWVSVFPLNALKGKPTVIGTIILNSPQTGERLAVIEGNTITALRTAAVASLAAARLANPAPKQLAIVGAGLQARFQLKALLARYGKFSKIKVWGYIKGEADKFCGSFPGVRGLEPAGDVRSCVCDADLIVTCTSSRKPLVMNKWVREGAHINAIGADAKGKEELDPKLVRRAAVVVDEWEQASHSGEINVPVSKGLFGKKRLRAELAEVVSEKKAGRRTKREITIFDSTGLAILDIYFARYLYYSVTRALHPKVR